MSGGGSGPGDEVGADHKLFSTPFTLRPLLRFSLECGGIERGGFGTEDEFLSRLRSGVFLLAKFVGIDFTISDEDLTEFRECQGSFLDPLCPEDDLTRGELEAFPIDLGDESANFRLVPRDHGRELDKHPRHFGLIITEGAGDVGGERRERGGDKRSVRVHGGFEVGDKGAEFVTLVDEGAGCGEDEGEEETGEDTQKHNSDCGHLVTSFLGSNIKQATCRPVPLP